MLMFQDEIIPENRSPPNVNYISIATTGNYTEIRKGHPKGDRETSMPILQGHHNSHMYTHIFHSPTIQGTRVIKPFIPG